ncbi:MAG: c-type cytochrome domain-containing protein [Prosthecobacter sp.]
MKCLALSACLVVGLAAGCSTTPTRPFEALAGHDYFMQNVKPVLETRCLACHREANPPAGLSLVQRSALYAPRRHGRAYVVPGDPMNSLLLTSVAESGRHPQVVNMDPLLTPRQIDILYEWIEDGAHWPDNPAGFLQPRHSGEIQTQTTTTYRVVEYSK